MTDVLRYGPAEVNPNDYWQQKYEPDVRCVIRYSVLSLSISIYSE
jgi:hypothetical protein